MQAGRIFINEIGSKGVIIKGGHSNDADIAKDYLFTKEGVQTFENERFKTKHTHGTGCTFSAVITAELAKVDHYLRLYTRLKVYFNEYTIYA